MKWKRTTTLIAFGMSVGGTLTPGGGESLLRVRIVDEFGRLLPCRAWVDVPGQRLFEPESPTSCTPYSRDRSFSCDGIFELRVPSGKATLHIERGKEYLPQDRVVMVGPRDRKTLEVKLHRWINLPEEGWYSADLHVHLGAKDPVVLRQLALADDVHLTPAFTCWLRGKEPSWPEEWPAWLTEREGLIDHDHILTYHNVEIERINRESVPGGSIGASFLFNLTKPVTAVSYGVHFPLDSTLCLGARAHSPQVVIDTDKPSWAESVVGAALGAYDTVQVCHNHYHRNATLSGGWGMIGPLEEGESNAAEGDGLFYRTNHLYYRFLNCGFRLGVSGGSAIGVMPVPMGYSRVYAAISGPMTSEKFWSSVKAGRTFATSGPIVTLMVNEHPIGATIKRTAGNTSPLEVTVRVRSIHQLESLQLVQDGNVIGHIDLSHILPSPVLDRSVGWQVNHTQRSGWLAARALFRAPDGRLRQAHTSPVYLEIDSKPIARKADALYMLQWIDRLVEIANQPRHFPSEVERDQVLAIYDQVRGIYQTIAIDAEHLWGD